MSVRVVIREAAARDIDEAYTWYEDREAGLGRRFLDAVQARLTTIVDRPLGYPLVLKDARRALLGRFPYSIYYRVLSEEVRGLGVLHQSRSPRTWQRRARG